MRLILHIGGNDMEGEGLARIVGYADIDAEFETAEFSAHMLNPVLNLLRNAERQQRVGIGYEVDMGIGQEFALRTFGQQNGNVATGVGIAVVYCAAGIFWMVKADGNVSRYFTERAGGG